uniref:Uncharacterized protein n=1 Tax=Anguilla anguilla TaxID=7936 RepID=A0A0E9V8T8_ANGAN
MQQPGQGREIKFILKQMLLLQQLPTTINFTTITNHN